MSLACACLGPQNGGLYCPCEMKRLKEMSVKELDFQINTNNIIIKTLESKDLAIAINGRMVCLDRNQAHLLMLYLREHLK